MLLAPATKYSPTNPIGFRVLSFLGTMPQNLKSEEDLTSVELSYPLRSSSHSFLKGDGIVSLWERL
jgi:hypothetical protein